MTKETKLITSILLGSTLLTSALAADDIRTLTATWSGASEGNGASAIATFDLDVTALNISLASGGYTGDLAGLVSDLTITVTGASAGNGIFTTPDFDLLLVRTSGTDRDFDPSGDWANNPNLTAFTFGSDDGGPSATAFKQMAANGDGDAMDLISGTDITATPEPSTLALASIGGIGAFFLARRRK